MSNKRTMLVSLSGDSGVCEWPGIWDSAGEIDSFHGTYNGYICI